MSHAIGAVAKFHYLGSWRDEDIAALIRLAEEPSCPFMFAQGIPIKKIKNPASLEGRSIGPWFYSKVDSNDFKRAQNAFQGGTSTTLFVIGKPSFKGKWKVPPDSQTDLQIFVHHDLQFTSLRFGGTYIDRGNDEFLASGGLDEEMSMSLHMLETLASWRCPDYGWLGRGGGFIQNLDIMESIKAATLADPKLRWITIFGPSYVQSLGLDFLLKIPGYRVERIGGGGVLCQVTKDFLIWGEQSPSPKDIESYLHRHPNFKKVRYQPVYARDILSPKAYQAVMVAETGVPQSVMSPPRHWEITDVSQIPELLKPTPALAKEQFGVDLDFSPESLKALDGALKQEYLEDGSLDEEDIEAVSISLGAYIGEVVRRHIGGEWQIADEPPSPRLVDVPGFDWLDPIGRVEKRLLEGEAASLFDWFQSIRRHSRK